MVQFWKGLSILLIVIVLALLFDKSYCKRKQLIGIWNATPEFCNDASISSFVFKINDDMKSGSMVMLNGTDVLSNSTFKISYRNFLPSNREIVNLTFDSTSPVPKNCMFEIDKDSKLYIKTDKKNFGTFVKIV